MLGVFSDDRSCDLNIKTSTFNVSCSTQMNNAPTKCRQGSVILLADPSVVLGQLGDVLPAAYPGSSQQAERETHPKGNLRGQSTSACLYKS